VAIEGRLTRTYLSGGVIAPYRIVKFAGTTVVQGAAATDLLIGATRELGTEATAERVDIFHDGITPITAGGTITSGSPITSDATGRAVVAAPAAGVNNRIIGFALEAAVIGDVFDVLIAPAQIQG
jgi:Uncharacterized conserved protein (DUF2190)